MELTGIHTILFYGSNCTSFVFNLICLYLIRHVIQDSEDAGKTPPKWKWHISTCMYEWPTEHVMCSFLFILLTFGLLLFLCTCTHTQLVADICLLPVVLQRVLLDVLWSMLCWMMRVSTWEIAVIKQSSVWIQKVASAALASCAAHYFYDFFVRPSSDPPPFAWFIFMHHDVFVFLLPMS